MRFVPEGEEPHSLPLLSTDPTLTISNRVKEIADLVEKQLIEDAVSVKKNVIILPIMLRFSPLLRPPNYE